MELRSLSIFVEDNLRETCKLAGVDPKTILYKIYGNTLFIYTDRPGLIIGKQGIYIEKLRNDLRTRCPMCEIIIEEVRRVRTEEEMDAYLEWCVTSDEF